MKTGCLLVVAGLLTWVAPASGNGSGGARSEAAYRVAGGAADAEVRKLRARVAELEEALEELEQARGGRYIFTRRGRFVVRVDTREGRVAFLNDTRTPLRWETLVIEEVKLENFEGFFPDYIRALKGDE